MRFQRGMIRGLRRRGVRSTPVGRRGVRPTPILKEAKQKKVKLNRAKFLSWVKRSSPRLYRMALLRAGRRGRRGLSGLGVEGESWWDSLVTGIKEAIPAALQYKQQKDLMKMQLARAEAGLPPANVADYTPVLKIQTELAPETRAAFIDQLGKPLVFGALALGVFMLFKK